MSSEPDRILTLDEAAALLRLKPSTVADHARKGWLPCLKFGRQVRYSERDLLDWVASRRQPVQGP